MGGTLYIHYKHGNGWLALSSLLSEAHALFLRYQVCLQSAMGGYLGEFFELSRTEFKDGGRAPLQTAVLVRAACVV